MKLGLNWLKTESTVPHLACLYNQDVLSVQCGHKNLTFLFFSSPHCPAASRRPLSILFLSYGSLGPVSEERLYQHPLLLTIGYSYWTERLQSALIFRYCFRKHAPLAAERLVFGLSDSENDSFFINPVKCLRFYLVFLL